LDEGELMSTSEEAVASRRGRPSRESEESAIQRLWGVSVCRRCGTTIALGEGFDRRGDGAFTGLCVSCASALTAAPVPTRTERPAAAVTDRHVAGEAVEPLAAHLRDAA
jgi:hypothetical protein